MKILFCETEDWEEEYLRTKLPSAQLQFGPDKLQDMLAQAKEAEIISCFIYSTITREIIDQLPNLKLIATRSTGFDHVDVAYCKQKGITVVNVPTYGVHTVAEHTFALILSLSRKIIPSVERAREGNFSLEGLRGFDLNSKTLGVIGEGNIGKKVIELAKAFGMNVIVFTNHPANQDGVSYVTLEELLGIADIVTLHLPENKETHHIINRTNIEKFKKGAMLVNTARGALIETEAILEGLEKRILNGVALDVLEEECFLKEERELLSTEYLKTCDLKTQLLNHVLLRRDDVIITPHNAFNSKEALSQILDTTIANIESFTRGKASNTV